MIQLISFSKNGKRAEIAVKSNGTSQTLHVRKYADHFTAANGRAFDVIGGKFVEVEKSQ